MRDGPAAAAAPVAPADSAGLRWRPVAIGAGALAVLALLASFARTPALPVQTARVESGELFVRVTTNGAVEPIDKAEVRARLDGRIVEIPDPGTRVEAGAVILRIDPGPVAAELAAAESERLAALESLREARNRLERVRGRHATDAELFAEGGITPARWRESQAELAEASSRVRFLEREVPLRTASLDLRIAELSQRREAAEVKAPFAGTVYKTSAKLGQTVAVGDPILGFADLERLRVRTNIDQVDLGRVGVGQAVEISSNAYPDRVWTAEISEVIPHVVVKESRFVAEALADVGPSAEGLVPGMTVDVEVVVESVPDALQVPAEAIFEDDAGSFVYRIDDGTVQETRVRLGRTTVDAIEVLSGLRAGDAVALGPVEGIEDGMRVKTITEASQRDDG